VKVKAAAERLFCCMPSPCACVQRLMRSLIPCLWRRREEGRLEDDVPLTMPLGRMHVFSLPSSAIYILNFLRLLLSAFQVTWLASALASGILRRGCRRWLLPTPLRLDFVRRGTVVPGAGWRRDLFAYVAWRRHSPRITHNYCPRDKNSILLRAALRCTFAAEQITAERLLFIGRWAAAVARAAPPPPLHYTLPAGIHTQTLAAQAGQAATAAGGTGAGGQPGGGTTERGNRRRLR